MLGNRNKAQFFLIAVQVDFRIRRITQSLPSQISYMRFWRNRICSVFMRKPNLKSHFSIVERFFSHATETR